MNKLIQDLRYGLRQLRKSPAFTLTVIVTLALGIGANTAVFTLFDQVLLRMLPVERPKELVRFQWSGDFSGSASSFGGSSNDFFSYPMYKDLRDQNQIFAGLLAADKASLGISWHNQSESDEAELVSGNYFQLLGLKPALGRLLTQQDDTARNSNPVVVLSYNAWKTRFGAVADIVGQTILINGHPFSVIGVAPQNFDSAIGGYRPSAFIPMSMVDIAMPWMAPRDDLNSHKSIWLTMVGRLKPGVTAVQAQASLEPLWHSLRAIELSGYKSPSERFKKGFLDNSHLKVLDDSKGFNPNRTEMQKPLVILMSMAGLLIALCAINVATLLLLRAAGRAREMSMRYALGAKRGRIVSQLLVEGGLLGIGGAAAGLALAPMVALALVRLMTSSDPGQEPYSASIDIRTLLFTLGVSLLASLLFSIAPIFHFLRPDLANSLRQSAGTASKGSQLFRKIAVGVQIALSVLLLGGAGLFVRTLDNLRHQSVGFETSNLATFSLDPSSSGYGEAQTAQIVSNSIDTLSRIPGVISVAATNDAELQGDSEGSSFSLQDYKTSEDEVLSFEDARVTANYFATLRHPLLVGREIASSDVAGQQPVAVVNLALAKKYYGSAQNAIGRLISEGRGKDTKFDTTIVGVVGDSRHTDLRTPLKPAIYRPYAQQKHPGGVEVYVRATQAPEAIEPAIRTAIHQMDATLVVDELRTMQEQVDRAASDERALALLAISFSALALLLAAVGFYGVLAYSTAQRTREIGVRLALGSRRVDVVLLVVREMAMIAAIATAIALPSVVAVSHYFSSQLYGVTNFDPLSLGAAALLTALMVTVAAALPARRAAAIEPMQALRTE